MHGSGARDPSADLKVDGRHEATAGLGTHTILAVGVEALIIVATATALAAYTRICRQGS